MNENQVGVLLENILDKVNGIAAGQNTMGQKLDQLDQRLSRMENKLDYVDTRLTIVERDVSQIKTDVDYKKLYGSL